jgi:hypothetical protein
MRLNRMSIFLLSAALLSGCIQANAEAPTAIIAEAPTTPPTPTEEPLPAPTQAVPTETVQPAAPAQAEPPPNNTIEALLMAPVRVIPTDLDPHQQPQDVFRQYQQTVQAGSTAWAVGTIQPSQYFGIYIRLAQQDPQAEATLIFPIHLSITTEDLPIEGLNILSPDGGGGGGASKFFSIPVLAAGEYDLMPDDPASFTLKGSELVSFTYDFFIPCQSAGWYTLDFTIPYQVPGDSAQDGTLAYSVSLVCPQSAAQWLITDPSTGQIENYGSWEMENGKYLPIDSP